MLIFVNLKPRYIVLPIAELGMHIVELSLDTMHKATDFTLCPMPVLLHVERYRVVGFRVVSGTMHPHPERGQVFYYLGSRVQVFY